MGSDLFVIGFTGGSHVSVITIDKSSQAQRAVTVPALWSSWNSDCSLIAGTELVCIDNMKATLQLLNLKKPDAFKVTFLPVISYSHKVHRNREKNRYCSRNSLDSVENICVTVRFVVSVA